jgi:type II secretory pathway component GspD/PulD (secretin)
MMRLQKRCFIFLILFIVMGQAPLRAVDAPAVSPVVSSVSSLVSAPEVSLDYTNANLPTVLKSLAYSYDLNIVIGQDVEGKVSAQLKNISIDNAFNAILNINGYGFYRKDNIVYIVPQAEMQLVTETLQLNYLFAKDSKELVSKLLSKQGDIQINSSMNSLVVTDYVENVAKVKELIKDIDQPPLQVLIEAKIVDIKTSEVEKIGTAWNSPAGSDPAKDAKNISSGSVTKDVDGALIKLAPRFKNLSANFSIDALLQQSDAHVLASPSIATLSGLEARIIIGDRIPYKSSTNFISSGTGGTTTNSVVQFAEVGTTLKVTPLVSSDGWITMKVHPEVSSVVQIIQDAGPQITTREADATIRVRDNETIIIGGLMGKNQDHSENGVPGLSTVPGFGWLFKRHASNDTQSELMVFITPHIIAAPSNIIASPKTAVREVRVDPQSFGQDMAALTANIDYAERLEKDASKKPAEDFFYRLELIKVYKMILLQFPDSGRSDFCLYKIASIYANDFGKCAPAKEALTKLQEKFPDSAYLKQTQDLVNACFSAMYSGQKRSPAVGR